MNIETEHLKEHFPLVGTMITSYETTQPATTVKEVTEKFFASNQLDALALVDCREPVGLVTRSKLLYTVFSRYGFQVFGKKPVLMLADLQPLALREDERLDTAINMALARPPRDVYDEIIVTDGGGYFKGLLSVKQMLIQQSNILANSIVQKELAHAKTRELEKINEMKSQFIANVTHELRSPVNAIIGLVELLKQACEKGHINQLKDRLSLLRSTGTSLRAVITNILDLSKIESGRMDVINERFDLVKILREVAETTRVLIGDKPVDVEIIAHDGPFFLISDPIKLRQVLINLMGNAAKFTVHGRITLSFREERDSVHIFVNDTGPGIRDTDLEKLFQAFSQIEDAKTKRHEGTGLGLYIAKMLLGLLGGAIAVSSTYGTGTTFEIQLPVRPSASAEAKNACGKGGKRSA
jgi:signal transduction histidine kinase